MREIKFRAWDKVEKEMIEWSELRKLHASLSYIEESERLDARILMQYTGLKDKNGKEIYVGDIVKTHLGTDKRIKFLDTFEKIDFKDGCFIVNSITCKGQWNELYKETNRIEIIGNIYENPELIK